MGLNRALIQHVASQLGINLDTDDNGNRRDAGETAAFLRQLEYVYSQTYDIKHAALRAREFIPVDSSVPTGADSYTYQQWDMFGEAKIIANYGDDLPRVDVQAKEFTAPIKSLGNAYGFSIQDVRRAAMSGASLETRRAAMARRAHEQAIDEIGAFGNAAAGLPGFLNNTNIPIVAPDNAPWATATALEIIADLNKLTNSIITVTKDVEKPDTLILDLASFQLVNTMPMSSTGDADKTVLKFFLDNNPYIQAIDSWTKLEDAGAAGVTRIVAYRRDPEVLQMVIPQEFEQLPPQARNLEFVIPCHSRKGGVKIHYPLACAFMDGTGEPGP